MRSGFTSSSKHHSSYFLSNIELHCKGLFGLPFIMDTIFKHWFYIDLNEQIINNS